MTSAITLYLWFMTTINLVPRKIEMPIVDSAGREKLATLAAMFENLADKIEEINNESQRIRGKSATRH